MLVRVEAERCRRWQSMNPRSVELIKTINKDLINYASLELFKGFLTPACR